MTSPMSKEPVQSAYVMSGQFTPDNCALILIDHQVGTLQFVHTMSPESSLRNAVTLAKAAKAYGMPVVITTSQEDHVQGPTSPALIWVTAFCLPPRWESSAAFCWRPALRGCRSSPHYARVESSPLSPNHYAELARLKKRRCCRYYELHD